MNRRLKMLMSFLVLGMVLIACTARDGGDEQLKTVNLPATPYHVVKTVNLCEPKTANVILPLSSSITEPIIEEEPFSDEEVEAIALTLAGECYDDKTEDKRRVAEVIVNRVSDGRFGNDVIEVVTAEHQFYGYWNQSREITESDIQIAEDTLRDWYSNDCEALSEYLYFYAGSNQENVFRTEF